jgi:hypothetical protein
MGVLLGLTRTHARSKCGSRVYDLKSFYRRAKITVVRAISLKKVVGMMTLNGSMDGKAFSVFVEHFLLRLKESILSTSKTGLQAAATVLNKPGICCMY